MAARFGARGRRAARRACARRAALQIECFRHLQLDPGHARAQPLDHRVALGRISAAVPERVPERAARRAVHHLDVAHVTALHRRCRHLDRPVAVLDVA
ncbi:hypothetical protein DP49_5542 [Burkholderia pseudomallei]|nr:hypothetical protein DP49_5542 [Burkholderia pseudomallei]KOS94700.1 hypothetical protein DM45_3331 [Burkholderia mallei]KOT11313.1 hypothetical protein DM77_2827 [Burkholderia mallei]